MERLMAQLGIATLILIAGFVSGLKVQQWRFDAKERAVLEARATAAKAEQQKARDDADAVGKALIEANNRAERDRIDFQRRLRDERERRVPLIAGCDPKPIYGRTPGLGKPGIESGPGDGHPMLTGNFVRLWNDALMRGEPGGGDPDKADGPGGAAGAVDPFDALDNLGENAGRWKRCRDALTGWQDLARRRGWAK